MRSLTGGVVYHGEKLPELRGAYIYGDWSTGKILGLKHEKGRVTWHKELASTTLQITGFGLDSHGELLIADHGGGYYRLEPTPKEEHPAKFPDQTERNRTVHVGEGAPRRTRPWSPTRSMPRSGRTAPRRSDSSPCQG